MGGTAVLVAAPAEPNRPCVLSILLRPREDHQARRSGVLRNEVRPGRNDDGPLCLYPTREHSPRTRIRSRVRPCPTIEAMGLVVAACIRNSERPALPFLPRGELLSLLHRKVGKSPRRGPELCRGIPLPHGRAHRHILGQTHRSQKQIFRITANLNRFEPPKEKRTALTALFSTYKIPL